jgi:hypothetical protein
MLLKRPDPDSQNTELQTKEMAHAAMSRQLLQKFLNKHNSDRDIYYDLMQYKVREISACGQSL